MVKDVPVGPEIGEIPVTETDVIRVNCVPLLITPPAWGVSAGPAGCSAARR